MPNPKEEISTIRIFLRKTVAGKRFLMSANSREKNPKTLFPHTFNRFTLAMSDTLFQFPPDMLNLPDSILFKISVGVSSGPLAKGV